MIFKMISHKHNVRNEVNSFFFKDLFQKEWKFQDFFLPVFTNQLVDRSTDVRRLASSKWAQKNIPLTNRNDKTLTFRNNKKASLLKFRKEKKLKKMMNWRTSTPEFVPLFQQPMMWCPLPRVFHCSLSPSFHYLIGVYQLWRRAILIDKGRKLPVSVPLHQFEPFGVRTVSSFLRQDSLLSCCCCCCCSWYLIWEKKVYVFNINLWDFFFHKFLAFSSPLTDRW